MLEVLSFEVPVESVETVRLQERMHSWRQTIPDLKICDREATRACERNGEQIGIGGP